MNEQQRVAEEEVRDLIAAAGPRPAAPAAEVARIEAAARAEWRELAAAEHQRRRGLRLRARLAFAASVVLALAVGWWWSQRPVPLAGPVVASVELLAGGVRAEGPGGRGEAVELALGSELAAGATVVTADGSGGGQSGAALRLGGGQSLRLAAGTAVRLLAERRFELERGTLYVDSAASAAAAGVEVVTRLGTVRDIGTQFEVRLGRSGSVLRVRVREGTCALTAGGARHLAARGDQLSLDGDGTVRRAAVEPYGPEWDWVMATAPSIEVEGLALSSFLDWAAREIGRDLRYADPAQAAEVAGITLHGSTAGLTPTQALELVLTGSGLAHEIEDGTILITR